MYFKVENVPCDPFIMPIILRCFCFVHVGKCLEGPVRGNIFGYTPSSESSRKSSILPVCGSRIHHTTLCTLYILYITMFNAIPIRNSNLKVGK